MAKFQELYIDETPQLGVLGSILDGLLSPSDYLDDKLHERKFIVEGRVKSYAFKQLVHPYTRKGKVILSTTERLTT